MSNIKIVEQFCHQDNDNDHGQLIISKIPSSPREFVAKPFSKKHTCMFSYTRACTGSHTLFSASSERDTEACKPPVQVVNLCILPVLNNRLFVIHYS